ncbi:inosine/xanthosine triphosphatase [Natrarchaeobaculum sulfurireducens]|uniref:Probable inosine/xanthosine triphosphatase n=1 Tax=Natrarchaeobaculum sulfurireducens TaxID=2044521 RepID=A0A346PHX2_9EURY|nr:inosine/xanthosine triphosphatase [Natrarchaeobaculum sulfurireducens]AXR79117.1 Inosine/xanthosine triphosphatase [Natrarchaeobaculum sulfurireducens]
MHVAVGSTNPVKVEAVERTLSRYEPSVVAVAVDSGVPEQPWSIPETVRGAETRSHRALEATDANYGIGLEGGVADLEGVPGLSLVMWAAVTDGRRLERGSGPSIRLPDRVASRLDAGEELGPVMDDLLGTSGVAKTEGAAGVLTDGLTDRTSALSQAVACAFGPFQVPYYD